MTAFATPIDNAFVAAATNHATTTRTENGDKTFNTSLNNCVDLFFMVGALRAAKPERVTEVFSRAYFEDPDVATRIALYGRDVRGGAGERKTFRTILTWLEAYDIDRLLRVIPLVAEIGRWDDLFVVMNNDRSARAVLKLFSAAIKAGNGLAAKWAPRENRNKELAARIRAFMKLDKVAYRKLIARLSSTVEQQMCAKQWPEIVYPHVPSVASARYSKVFGRHDTQRYVEYLDNVKKGKVDAQTGKIAKINTGAVFPYDVIKQGVDDVTADTMWNKLPDLVPQGVSFMPIVDTSGSMQSPVGGTTTALDVAVSLGIYLAERNKSAFKDVYMTFNTNPRLHKIAGGTIRDKVHRMIMSDQSMHGSTNLDAAMRLIVNLAVAHKVSVADMPSTLIVMSDMEFNGGGYNIHGMPRATSVAERTKAMFAAAGYPVPNIVWWNIQSRNGNVPVRANEQGMALVSGFSPSIVNSVLDNDISPTKVMIKTISKDRYDH